MAVRISVRPMLVVGHFGCERVYVKGLELRVI